MLRVPTTCRPVLVVAVLLTSVIAGPPQATSQSAGVIRGRVTDANGPVVGAKYQPDTTGLRTARSGRSRPKPITRAVIGWGDWRPNFYDVVGQ